MKKQDNNKVLNKKAWKKKYPYRHNCLWLPTMQTKPYK